MFVNLAKLFLFFLKKLAIINASAVFLFILDTNYYIYPLKKFPLSILNKYAFEMVEECIQQHKI